MASTSAGATALRNVTLDDKYELESGRVYLTGVATAAHPWAGSIWHCGVRRNSSSARKSSSSRA